MDCTVHGILQVWILEWVGSSAGKESFSSAGDPVLIPAWGTSAGEGIGYPRQYSWASLVVQLVKNPPAMQETWFQALGCEDFLEKGTALDCIVHGIAKSQMWLSNFDFCFTVRKRYEYSYSLSKTLKYFSALWDNYLEQAERAQIS